jgi:hypothetical protein
LTNGLNAGEHGDDTAESPIALTAELPVLAFPKNVASRQDSAAIIEGRKP